MSEPLNKRQLAHLCRAQRSEIVVFKLIQDAGEEGISRDDIQSRAGLSRKSLCEALGKLTAEGTRRVRVGGHYQSDTRRLPLYVVGSAPDAKLKKLQQKWTPDRRADPPNLEKTVKTEITKKHRKWAESWTPRRCFVFEPECVIGAM